MNAIPVLVAFGLVTLEASMGSLRISDAARVQARRGPVDDTALDVHNLPRLQAGLGFRRGRFELDYAPRLAWLDVGGTRSSPALVLHRAAAQLSVRGPRYRLALSQTAVVGDQDFTQRGRLGPSVAAPAVGHAEDAAPAQNPGVAEMAPDVELRPNLPAVEVLGVQTGASVWYAWSRRWSSQLDVGLGVSGGADAEAQALYPRQRTAELDASLGFRRSRRDRLVTRAGGSQIHTSNGYEHWLASLSEGWALDWTPTSGSELGLGAALQHTTPPEGSHATALLPVASASVWHMHQWGAMQAQFVWSVDYGPNLNALLGELQDRISGSGQASLGTEDTSVNLAVVAAQSFPVDAARSARLVSASLAFDHELVDWLGLQLGGQLTQQRMSAAAPARASLSLWVVYAGLEARLPEVRCC